MNLKFLFSLFFLTMTLSACELPVNTDSQAEEIPTTTSESSAETTETETISEETIPTPDLFNTTTKEVSIKDVISQVKNSPLANDNTYTQCLQQSLSSCESQAVYLKVQTSGNADDCNILSDEYAKNTCKDNVFSNNALKNKNASDCNSLKEEYRQQQCKTDVYRMLARENLDTSYCAKIATVYPESETSSDGTSSDGTSSDDTLIFNTTGNFGEQYSKQCEYDVYMEEARKNNDVKVCDKIDDTNMKEMCKQTLQYFNTTGTSEQDLNSLMNSGVVPGANPSINTTTEDIATGTGIETNTTEGDTVNTSETTKTRGVPKQ
jgi:hypothetical protein